MLAIPSERAELARDRFNQLRDTAPKLRFRDAAERLAMSEAELLAAFSGSSVRPLADDWSALLPQLESLGDVMALTRNDNAVIENVGTYRNTDAKAGLVLGDSIDLRLFLDRWRYGFAVDGDESLGFHRSLQFFDATGTAVHKIFLRPESSSSSFEMFVERWQSSSDDSPQPLAAQVAHARSDRDIDVAALRAAWNGMRDTHDVFDLLRRFELRRSEALALLGEPSATPLDAIALRLALEQLAAEAVPAMVFVGSAGVVQIYTGAIHRVQVTGAWVNVLDPGFNLHVHETGIANAWAVRRPTVDGVVTSLDLFDADGELILQLFGKRKPGAPELEAWRRVVAALPSPEAAHA